jgi:hypothetical protein
MSLAGLRGTRGRFDGRFAATNDQLLLELLDPRVYIFCSRIFDLCQELIPLGTGRYTREVTTTVHADARWSRHLPRR